MRSRIIQVTPNLYINLDRVGYIRFDDKACTVEFQGCAGLYKIPQSRYIEFKNYVISVGKIREFKFEN